MACLSYGGFVIIFQKEWCGAIVLICLESLPWSALKLTSNLTRYEYQNYWHNVNWTENNFVSCIMQSRTIVKTFPYFRSLKGLAHYSCNWPVFLLRGWSRKPFYPCLISWICNVALLLTADTWFYDDILASFYAFMIYKMNFNHEEK